MQSWRKDICSTHRKSSKRAPDDILTEASAFSVGSIRSNYVPDGERSQMNRILNESGISPIKSQAKMQLEAQSAGSIQRMVAKFNQCVRNFGEKIADTIAPGQGIQLLELAKLDNDNGKNDNNQTRIIMNNEMVSNLKKVYDFYINNNMPFIEQVRIIALLPRNWTYDQVMNAFGCSKSIVDKFAIPQNERKRLQKQIQVAEMYQKSRYAGHCSLTSDCVTHCITFGLSDPSSPHFETKCQHSHTTNCSGCVNIFNTLDEFEKIVKEINDREMRTEAHVRLGTENFTTKYREPQKDYFGKRGMSLLAGSFVWKDNSSVTTTTTATTTPFRTASEVLKGKDICDRIMDVSKSRLRAWESNGHDIQNAVDIKEGFEYADGIKDTKVAVAQIIDDEERVLGASNIPNVTTVRSIVYDANGMKIRKASGIGKGKYVPYKNIDFE
ncbi:unnamed protein product, partial [Didymodactylos carnosus]